MHHSISPARCDKEAPDIRPDEPAPHVAHAHWTQAIVQGSAAKSGQVAAFAAALAVKPEHDISDLFKASQEPEGLHYMYTNSATGEAACGTLSAERELHVSIDGEGEQRWSDCFRSLMARLAKDGQLVDTLAITWLPDSLTMAILHDPLTDAAGATWVAAEFGEFGFTQVRSATRGAYGEVRAVFQRPA